MMKVFRGAAVFAAACLTAANSAPGHAALLFDLTDASLPVESASFQTTSGGVTLTASNPIGDSTDAGASETDRFFTDFGGLLIGDDDLTSFDFVFDAPVVLTAVAVEVNTLLEGAVNISLENTVTLESASVDIVPFDYGVLPLSQDLAFEAGQLGRFTAGGTPVDYDFVQLEALVAVPEPSTWGLAAVGLAAVLVVAGRKTTRRRSAPQTASVSR